MLYLSQYRIVEWWKRKKRKKLFKRIFSHSNLLSRWLLRLLLLLYFQHHSLLYSLQFGVPLLCMKIGCDANGSLYPRTPEMLGGLDERRVGDVMPNRLNSWEHVLCIKLISGNFSIFGIQHRPFLSNCISTAQLSRWFHCRHQFCRFTYCSLFEFRKVFSSFFPIYSLHISPILILCVKYLWGNMIEHLPSDEQQQQKKMKHIQHKNISSLLCLKCTLSWLARALTLGSYPKSQCSSTSFFLNLVISVDVDWIERVGSAGWAAIDGTLWNGCQEAP